MAENIFEKVLENVNIIDVISEFVELTPKGKNHFGVCPFHDDKNPSMSVTTEKGDHGIYYCFTCKAGGNAIKFVQDYKHISYLDATKYIANRYHIDISEYKSIEQDKLSKYYDIMGVSSAFFKFLMNDENLSKKAREYLNNRGITNETIKDFNIGISSEDNLSLTKTLLNKKYLMPDIVLNGLSNGNTDTFVDRIIIPIRDEMGRTVAFGGRTYKESQKDLNKYLNSQETPIFKKGELVFNLDRASKVVKEYNYLILNEGYMDVIQAYSNGLKNSIALMGTSMTVEQAKLISKYTKNVAICLDGDSAGIKGVKSVVARLEEQNINVSITILKDGLDPDEYIRKYGIESYKNAILNERLDKSGYLYELTKLDYPVLNSFTLESFKNAVFSKLIDEKSNTQIESLLKRLSNDLKISFDSVKQDFENYIRPFKKDLNNKNKVNKKEEFPFESALSKAEKLVIDYALESRKYFNEIEIEMESRVFMKNELYRSIYIEIGDLYDQLIRVNKDILIDNLKLRGVYKDFNHDIIIDYSMDDLVNNVLRYIKNEELKEMKKDLEEQLKDPSISNEKRMNILVELTCLQKRLKEKRKRV